MLSVAIADVAALRAARLGARPRGAAARQLGLFPRPGRADAAGAHLERSVLAASGRGSRGARGAHGDRRRWTQALAHVPPRADALGRETCPISRPKRRSTAGPTRPPGPLLATVLEPLYAAYRALKRARDQRSPLDLDIPERKIVLTAHDTVDRVITPERLDAHRLIEEFMILANVAAAETLERAHTPADLSGARRARHGAGQCAARIPADARHFAAQGGRAACRAVQPHPRPGEGPRGRKARQRGGAAHAGAGGVCLRELRPLRAQPAALRAFHFADPPLCRSCRASRPDPRAEAR